MVERELEPLLPGIIHVRESQDVPRHLAGRIVAAVFARQIDTGYAERLDLLRLGRLAMPRQIEELPLQVARDPARQLLSVLVQRGRETRDLIGRERELLRVHPDGVDGGADGERLTVAIRDGAAMGRDLCHAREARIALPLEKPMVDELQVDSAPHQTRGTAHEQSDQHSCPPAIRARSRVVCAERLHGAMTSISFGGGIAIWSFVLATRSTKA